MIIFKLGEWPKLKGKQTYVEFIYIYLYILPNYNNIK
jgi:hypothetical protein